MRKKLKNSIPLVVAAFVVAISYRAFVLGRARKGGSVDFPDPNSNRSALASASSLPADATHVRIDSIIEMLAVSRPPGEVRKGLSELRTKLLGLPAGIAITQIREFLDGGRDASTGLGFSVGESGFLDDSPSLRVFLLDLLALIDPRAAAEYAEKILSEMKSPDEWAVALRNTARGGPHSQGNSYLESKIQEMIQREAWQKAPTAGFLEAFDVAVYLGGTRLVPLLSSLVRKEDNPPLAHGAFLALDRLVISNPAATLDAIQRQPELLQGRDKMRANFFARADLGDPDQHNVIERYLLHPGISQDELQTFANIFPNNNAMISYNLLTQATKYDRAALIQRDRTALEAVQQWLIDPRFATIRPQLQRIKGRLERFQREAQIGETKFN